MLPFHRICGTSCGILFYRGSASVWRLAALRRSFFDIAQNSVARRPSAS
jgi:hypothetical protein